jgi:hypothetical protein
MIEPVIEAVVVEQRIVVCPRCRRGNRMYKRRAIGVYRCGLCHSTLLNPFERRLGRALFGGRRIVYVVASIAGLLLLAVILNSVFAPHSPFSPNSTPPPETASTIIPSNNEILFDALFGSVSRGQLTVDNGTSHHAVAKLIKLQTDQKVLSFVVAAHHKGIVHGIPDGAYRLLFTFGDRLYAGTDRFFSSYGFSKFDSPMVFTTSSTEEAVYWDQLSVTLHPVFAGNARISSISQNDFERY